MKLSNGMEIRKADVSSKFGGDPMAEYLWHLSLDGGGDDETGDMDFGTHVTRFGRRLLQCDDGGSVRVHTFDDVAEAETEFQRIDDAHSQWQIGIRIDDETGTVELLHDGATVTLEYGDRHGVGPDDEWRQRAQPYTIVVKRVTEPEMLFPYWVGELASEPKAIEALACLVRDGEMVGWSTNAIEVDEHYYREVGERLSVKRAMSWAEQNRQLAPILSDLDSWNLEGWDR